LITIAIAAIVGATGAALLAMGIGFAMTSLLWFTLGIVLLLETRALEALLAPVAGLATFVVADRLLEPVSSIHLGLAAAISFAVALGLAAFVLTRALTPRPEDGPTRTISLESAIRDGIPYFLVGLLATVPIVLPHVIIWIGRGEGRPGWSAATVALELGLTLALAPLVISVGRFDRAIRGFWVAMTDVLRLAPVDGLDIVADHLIEEVHGRRIRYMRTLTVVSLLSLGIMDIAVLIGVFDDSVAKSQAGWMFGAFAVALVAYLLFGWGTFTNMYAVSLGQPRAALIPVLGSIAVLAIIGLPVALAWSFRAVILVLPLSTAAYAVLSTTATRRALEQSIHHYTTIS
jgi:hypothetical protein